MLKRKSARIYYDIITEPFNNHPMSIALVASSGQEFYAEFTEYKGEPLPSRRSSRYLLGELGPFSDKIGNVRFVKGTEEEVIKRLHKWLDQFRLIHFWGNKPTDHNRLIFVTLSKDFGDTEIDFLDMESMFDTYGFNPDIDREAFIDYPVEGVRFSSLYNAKVLEACYDKFYRNKERYNKWLIKG